MPYVLKTAHLIKKGRTESVETNISSMSLRNIFKNYTGTIILTHTQLKGDFALEIRDLKKAELPFPDVSFNNWLSIIGNKSLPTTNYVPLVKQTKSNHVTFLDAFAFGLKVKDIHSKYHGIEDSSLSDSIFISSVRNNLETLSDKFIVAVNGLLHQKESMNLGFKIIKARETIDKSKFLEVSLLNFSNVGSIKEVGFSNTEINKVTGIEMKESVLLETLTNLKNKSVVFSFCGCLITDKEVVTIIDRESGLLKLNLSMLNLFDLLTHIGKYIDFSSLGIPVDEHRRLLEKEELEKESVIRELLKSHLTFAIIIDNPGVETNYIYPFHTGLYGHYTENENYPYPLINSFGRIIGYRKFREMVAFGFRVADDEHEFPIENRSDNRDVIYQGTNSHWSDRLKSYNRFLLLGN